MLWRRHYAQAQAAEPSEGRQEAHETTGQGGDSAGSVSGGAKDRDMSCPSQTFGLYVHIPCCPQRCPYCAFTVLTGHTAFYDRYIEAVCTEIRSWQSLAHKGPLQTVFLGGGTPSLLDPVHVQQILDTATVTFGIAPEAEITLEANPTTADAQKFSAFRASGCNRLSLGVQSFNDADLKTLGRWHSAAEAEAAYITARQAGFTNVNTDGTFG